MTPDATASGTVSVPEDKETADVPRPSYEPPVLVPLGNVHALLASGGTSPTGDGSKVSMRIR